jgi:hypothetical protein
MPQKRLNSGKEFRMSNTATRIALFSLAAAFAGGLAVSANAQLMTQTVERLGTR